MNPRTFNPFRLHASSILAFALSAGSAWAVTATFSTSGTWTCPGGVTSISVAVQGGGGAGGAATTVNGTRGGGGGGGACAFNPTLTVEPGVTYTVDVGASVAGGTGAGAAGNPSSFSGGVITTLTANGGGGGGLNIGAGGSGGAGGTATGGTANRTGGAGDASPANETAGGGGGGGAGTDANGVTSTSQTGGAGGTGSPAGGAGANQSNSVGAGSTGGVPGGGGSGAYRGSSGTQNGGAGARGQITIVYTESPNFKANNTDDLNLVSSWTAFVPNLATAEWNSTVTSANTASLGGDLTFSGIRITDPGGLVTINSGNTLTLGAASTDIDLTTATQDLTLNCNLALGAANVWDVASSRTLTLGGTVSGAFAVTKQGSGTAILSGANTWTGTTTVSAGTLKLAASGGIPDGTGNGNVALAGTLDLNGNNETVNGLSGAGVVDNTAGSTASTLTVGGNNQTSSFSGILQNSGSSASLGLTKTGTGALTLTGANTHAGLTTINSGGLNIQNASALGASTTGTEVNGTATGGTGNARLELQGGITVSGEAVTIKGVGNFIGALASLGGSNEWTGGVTIGAASTRIGAFTGATLKISGVIDSGATPNGLLIRSTDLTGIVILSGANTYVGDTTNFVGKLQLDGGDNRLPVAGKLIVGSGTLFSEFDLNGRNQEVAGLAVTSSATSSNNSITNSSGTLSTLTVNAASSPSSFAAILAGNLALTKSGSDTLTLSGANTYTGATNVTAGTLLFSSAGSAVSDVTVSATASAGALVAATDGQFVSTGDLALANNSVLTIDYGTTTPSTSVAPIKVDNLTAGTGLALLLDGDNLAGLTVSQAYPLITWTTGPVDGSAFTTVINPRIQGTFSVSANTLFFTVTSNTSGSPLSWNTGNGTWDTATSNWVDGNLVATTFVNTFDAVRFGDAAGATGNPIVTLNTAFSPNGVTMNSTAHDYTISGSGSIGGNTSLTLDPANTRTLTLATANTYTGTTSVNGGTLRLGSGGTDGSLAATSAVSIGTGATFAVTQSDTVTQGTDFSTAAISGAGGLAQTGSGTTILNAVNTYTGPTTISGGILQIGGAGRLGAGAYAGDIAISGGATLQYSSTAAQTLSGIISGSGSLNKNTGSGNLTLSGTNTHTGTTTVGGVLVLGNVAALSTTTSVTLEDGAVLRPSLGGAAINAPITIGASGTNATIEAPNINPGSQTPVVLSLNGAIIGSGNVTFSSSIASNTINTVLLNTLSTYTGGTAITRSSVSDPTTQTIVKLGVNNALPVTTVVNIDGGDGTGSGRGTELNLNGFNQQLAGLTNTTRATSRRQRIVNSDVSAHAVLTINNTTDSTFTGELGGGAVFSVSPSATSGSTNGSNFSLVKSGVAKFTLGVSSGAGGLSYKGDTTVNAGILSLGRSNAGNDASTLTLASGAKLELTYAGTDQVGKLVINNVQQPDGVYGNTSTGATNGGQGVGTFDTYFEAGTGTITVVGGYASWTAGPFLGTLSNTSAAFDFDNGGLDTGIEWVVGGDPTDGSDDATRAPTFDNTTDPDFFIFTYRRTDAASTDTNTTIKVEYGSDISGWTPAVAGPDVIITPTNDFFGASPGIDKVEVKIRRTLAVGGKLFARLNVAIAP